MKIHSLAALALATATAAAGAGCGDSSGAGLVPVSGTVTQNGKALEGANVEFIPASDSKDARPGFDTTDAQGGYELLTANTAGVAPGKYTVVVTKYPEGKLEGAAAGVEGQPDPLMAEITADVAAQEAKTSGARKSKGKSSAPEILQAKFEREVPAAGGTFDLKLEEGTTATDTPTPAAARK